MEKKLYVILDNIRSAYNVGSIFRTADAVGCVDLYLCGMTATPANIKLAKTALGATNTVKWNYFDNAVEATKKLKREDVEIYGVETCEAGHLYNEVIYPEQIALVLGHELLGISQPVLDLCDKIISIPMKGSKTSLNVSVAAGIIMYEAVRDRK